VRHLILELFLSVR